MELVGVYMQTSQWCQKYFYSMPKRKQKHKGVEINKATHV